MKSSKQKHQSTKDKSPTAKESAKPFVVWAVIVLGIIALAVVSTREKQRNIGEQGPSTSQPEQVPTNAPSATPAQPSFQKLVGRWLRPDGGYIIEIKSADSTGRLDAGYFNPRPIHVAKAEAKQEGNAVKVFIELQDVNYPGSTYTLTYIPERDLLAGNYYQALQRQNFEVYFERQK